MGLLELIGSYYGTTVLCLVYYGATAVALPVLQYFTVDMILFNTAVALLWYYFGTTVALSTIGTKYGTTAVALI